MRKLSLEPDEHTRWIYDINHPDYKTAMAKDLRARREYALAHTPRWMISQAVENDRNKGEKT